MEHRVVVGSLAQERHQSHVPERREAASTWSTARPPSSHAVRANAQSERPRSRTDRHPRGSSVVSFDRAQERHAKRSLEAIQMREPAPADRLRGSHRMGRRRTRRTPSSSRPSATVPPLPREPLCQTRTPLSRGRGGGGGTTSCRPVVGIRPPSTTRSKPRRTASTWSTARPPSSHAVRASAQSERPRSRTDRRPRGSNLVTFDRAQIMCEP